MESEPDAGSPNRREPPPRTFPSLADLELCLAPPIKAQEAVRIWAEVTSAGSQGGEGVGVSRLEGWLPKRTKSSRAGLAEEQVGGAVTLALTQFPSNI